MKVALLLLFCLFASPARASDFVGEFEKNLDDFKMAYYNYERDPSEQNQTIVARIEQFLTDQVFSVVNEEKLYTAALGVVNQKASGYPAAIADLGMKLEIRWERDYLAQFYRVEGQRRRLYQVPADAILIMGGLMVGSRGVGNAAVVGKYFNTMRNLWIGGSAAPVVGTVAIETRIQRVPTPPAVLISSAQLDQLDFRAAAASDAQHRKNVARAIGIVAGGTAASYGLGVVAQLGTKNPWGAAALVVGVLAASAYIGATTEDLSEWSFALQSEEKLEQDVSAAMYDLAETEKKNRTDWTWAPSWLKPKWMKETKFEAVRELANSVLKLQANRDLKILLAEMTFQDTLDAIEAKYGPSQDIQQKKTDVVNAVAAYRVTLKGLVAARGAPLLDPMTTQWLGRRWLKETNLSPFVPAERAELKTVVDQWQSPLREYGIYWANAAQDAPSWAAMQHDSGVKLLHEMLDEEASKQAKGLFYRKDFPVPFYFDLPKRSDALFLVAANYVRSLNDPSIAHIADVMESRATHYAELLLDVRKDAL